MKKIIMATAVMAMFFPVASQAEGLAVGAKVGTLGMGLELTKGLSDSFGARLGFNTFNYSTTTAKSSINYDFKLQLQSFSLLGDWYPFQGAFRTSAGLYYNNNKFSLAGQPTGGSYVIGGTTYTAGQVGNVNGEVSFNKISPYIGLGWGNPAGQGKGWGLVSDFGLLMQGQPNTALSATCGAAIVGTAQCANLQNSVITERGKLQNSLNNFNLYPVASVGVTYQW
ncbi:MAG: hypothetical protein WCD45_08070 [Gallionella sp.]